jgi:transposase, IS6 family
MLPPHVAKSAHRRPCSFSLGVRRLLLPQEVVVLAVRWYLRAGLSYRDVEELLAERGMEVDHVTVNRCSQRCTVTELSAAERSSGFASVRSWQMSSSSRRCQPS